MQTLLLNSQQQAELESHCKHTRGVHKPQQWLFTYYELPFTKETLLSLCPPEDCVLAGLEATCLTRQVGEEEEERKEDGGREEEVEEVAEEEELAGKKAQRLRPSGLWQETFKSCVAPDLQERVVQCRVKEEKEHHCQELKRR